jgi:hypothetical protein
VSGVSGSDPQSAGDSPAKRKRVTRVKALWRKLFTPDSNWQPTDETGGNPIMIENTQLRHNLNHDLPWHCIRTETGSLLLFCTDECLNSYTVSAYAEDEHYTTVQSAPKTECVYCHWCSIRIHQPDTCFTHNNHCPILSWKYTHQAIECYNELNNLFQGNSIPAELLDEVEDIAEMYGTDLPGRAVARIAYKGWELFQ